MTKEVSSIYQRYNPQPPPPRNSQPINRNQQPSPQRQTASTPHQTPTNQQKPSVHHNKMPVKQSSSGQLPPRHIHQHAQQKQSPCDPVKQCPPTKDVHTSNRDPFGFLYNIIPRSLYNPQSKKILGLLSAEDLLIISLIFLFLDNNEEDNLLIILALAYVLLSDYIDLGDFSF